MRFSVRLTLAMAALVLLTAVVVGAFAYRGIATLLAPQATAQLADAVQQTVRRLDVAARVARADVLAASGAAEIAVIGRPDASEAAVEAARRDLGTLLLAQLRAKPDYLQFRLIGLESGRELVRADRTEAGGSAGLTPDDQLQFKGARDYVASSAALSPGEVHVSPIELNQEHGVIQRPFAPVLRVSTPVTGADGAVYGVMIVNLDMGRIFDELRAPSLGAGALRVFSGDGDLLISPQRDREFAAQLGGRAQVQEDFPQLAGAVEAQRSEARLIETGDGGRLAAATSFFRIADGPVLGVMRTQPYEQQQAVAAAAGAAGVPGLLLAVASAVILAAGLARSLARPFERIGAAVENFGRGGPLHLPDVRGREAAQLARTLERMAATIEETTANLRAEVDERRRANEALWALAARERLFRAAFESSDDAVLLLDLDGRIQFWNRAAERLYGWTAQEIVGRSPDLLIPEARAGETGRLLERIRAGEPVEHFETVRQNRQGREIDVSLSVSPVLSPEGEIVGVAKIARDVTARKLEAEMFRLAIEASPNAMILVDADRRIRLLNAAADRLFGHPPGALTGQRLERLLPTPPDAAPRDPQGQPQQAEAVRADGASFPVEATLNPILSREGEMTLAVVVDIGPQLEAQARIEAYTAELKRSNAELEQFAYIAAHDLQEPLRMVASYAQLLSQRYSGQLDARADRYIAHAVDGAKRMKELIDDLLAFSRVGTQGRPLVPVETGEVVRVVAERLRKAIDEAGGALEVEPLPKVLADDGQLAQLFQNLIANALKFRGQDPPRIRISVERSGERWVFSVEDNGIGIDPEQTERIFQMFQRLHERGRYEGSGIGLAVARKIVERHGGRIWVASTSDDGSTFRFALPVIEEARDA